MTVLLESVRRFGRMVKRIFRNLDGHVFFAHDSLARQTRLRFQTPGTIEIVLFQLVSLFQRVETLAE